MLGDAECDGLVECDGLTEGLIEPDGDTLGEPDALGEVECDGLAECDGDALGLAALIVGVCQ